MLSVLQLKKENLLKGGVLFGIQLLSKMSFLLPDFILPTPQGSILLLPLLILDSPTLTVCTYTQYLNSLLQPCVHHSPGLFIELPPSQWFLEISTDGIPVYGIISTLVSIFLSTVLLALLASFHDSF